MGGESDEHVGVSEHVPEFPSETSEAAGPAEPGLKHLEFLRVAIISGQAYAVKLYNYGKENSGSFRPRVDSVEETLRTVTGPLAERIQSQLPGLLQFADRKVGDTIQYLDIVIPQHIKDRSFQAYETARQAPDTARTAYANFQESSASDKAAEYYAKYKPVAETYANQAWQSLLSSPFTAQAVGQARVGAEKINEILSQLRDRNLPISPFIPMIPLNYVESTEEEREQFQVR